MSLDAAAGSLPDSIRALRLLRVGEVSLFDEPMPRPGPGETLVEITAVGLCGSDAHWFAEGSIGDAVLARPLVLGHEMAGRIAAGPRAGERVALDPAIPCLRCELCLDGKPHLCGSLVFAGHGKTDGALRTHMAWPERCLVTMPDNLSDAEGPLLEPLGVAIHAVDLVGLRPGQSAGVFGCGPIGLMLVELLRSSGAGTIVATDLLAHRVAKAAELGATLALRPDGGAERRAVMDATGGRGVDVAFDVSGSDDAIDTAIATVRPGGTVVLVGIPSTDRSSFDAATARRKGVTIRMCRRMLPHDLGRAARLAERGQIHLGSLITERFSLDEGAAAFASLIRRSGLKVVVEPNRAAESGGSTS
jgi:L-iditol 2-dehydrogenase